MCEFNATVTFLGQRYEIDTFLRDYINLQMLWESTMGVTLKRKLAVGERLIQHVPIPWSGENRAVHSDSDLMDVLAEFEAKKRRRPGRPKLQRRRGLNEPKKVPRSSSLKCSICHEVGHNSRTCKKKNDGQSGGNQGTTTSSTPSTSTANRRRMEVGSSSTSAPTSATVTRVLWYSNTPAPSSNENQFGLSSQQDVSQSAPQPSQQCSGNNGGGT
ncbi:hypothetical protein ACOSQ4_016459 [Xanthoceras sorbifolium]